MEVKMETAMRTMIRIYLQDLRDLHQDHWVHLHHDHRILHHQAMMVLQEEGEGSQKYNPLSSRIRILAKENQEKISKRGG
jgi:hypothetical protein